MYIISIYKIKKNISNIKNNNITCDQNVIVMVAVITLFADFIGKNE